MIDLNNGKFFTILRENAKKEYVYRFEYGGISLPNPIQEYKTKDRSRPYCTFYYAFCENLCIHHL